MGSIYLEEMLPQLKIDPSEYSYMCYREHAINLLKQFGVDKPFLFRSFKERDVVPGEEPYCMEGLSVSHLMTMCRDGTSNDQYLDTLRRLIQVCRVTSGLDGGKFGRLDSCKFIDGPIRSEVMGIAAVIYHKQFRSTRDCFRRFKDSLPLSYVPKRPSELALDGVTYYDESDNRIASSLPVLGMLASDIMLECVSLWMVRINISLKSQAKVEGDIGVEMMRALDQSDSLYRMSGYLNESKVIPGLRLIIYLCTMINARASYSPNILSTESCEWIMALIFLLLFPEDLIDESSIRACLILINANIMNKSVHELDQLTVEELRRMSRFSCLRVRGFVCEEGAVVSEVPFDTDTTFKIPFGMNMKGVHRLNSEMANLKNELCQVTPRLSNRVIVYISNVVSRITGNFSMVAVKLIMLL